ncbi:MAG: hypothetical protein ACYDHW_02360 [Syntrophorhabdaceae bacterium]
MKRHLASVFAFIITLIVYWLLTIGCAPTIREVSQDVIENEGLRNAREEGRETGRREGSNLCKQEMDDRLRDFVRKYRDELLYLELVKGGAITPAQVRLIYNPAKISKDGSSYFAPNLVWKIVSPPQFLSDDSSGDWLKRDRANFCYFAVDSFATESEAFIFLGNTPKPDDVFLTIAPHGNSGKWSVIAKAFRSKCDTAMAYYKKLGRQAIRVE